MSITHGSSSVVPLHPHSSTTPEPPRTFNGDIANPPPALTPLCLTPHWVLWKWQLGERGKWTKPPFRSDSPEQFAKTDDPETWSDRRAAVSAVLGGRANGIGFALTGTDIAAIDLDKCRNPVTQQIADWAQAIIAAVPDAYCEITVSGEGLRVIGIASGPQVHRAFNISDGARVEIFRKAVRYITVSGLEIGNCAKLPNIDHLIDTLIARYDNPGAQPHTGNGADIDHLIRHGVKEGERSEAFARVIWTLAGRGWSPLQIEQELTRYPNGIAAKYIDRLGDEIARCYRKWRAHNPDPAAPLPYIDIPREPIPPRRWFVHDKIPGRNVTLLSGEGGRGKSLLAKQLSAAGVLGRDWLGTLPEIGPVIYINCEDDDDEIRHRLAAIANHYGVSRKAIADDLHIISMVGQDAALASFDRATGAISPTNLFDRLHRDALRFKPKLIVLDSSADVFPGSEIDRRQTRQFVTLLRRLSIDTDAATVLISHPSLTGIASGSGLSGTTAWHNSTRARIYLRTPDEDSDKDADLRVLEFKKNNYGTIGETIVLRWRNGLYLPEPRAGSLERLAAEAKVDGLFLDILRQLIKQGRNVSERKGTSYAPAIFEGEPEAKAAKVTRKPFTEAMARLFAADKIKIVTEGPPSRRRSRLVEV